MVWFQIKSHIFAYSKLVVAQGILEIDQEVHAHVGCNRDMGMGNALVS